MLLTSLIDKPIIVNNTPRGICEGVGISKKDGGIKYLICSETDNPKIRFIVPFSLVTFIKQDAVHLQKLRTVTPTKFYFLHLNIPVYTLQGKCVGNVENASWANGTLGFLSVNGNNVPYTSISAISDAVLVRSTASFPLGQRIPVPCISKYRLRENTVTKSVLKKSVSEDFLIELTLSLAPFNVR